MGTKKYNPITPGFRQRQVIDFSDLSGVEPEKSLLVSQKNNSGRNNQGKVSVRRRGGGAKRKYRIIDFKRDKEGMEAVVKTVEYDPNRTAFICLVVYPDGEKRYIVAPQKLVVGSKISSGSGVDIKPGNSLKLLDIPVGSIIHNIEINIGKGAQLARSAGTSAVLMGKHDNYVTIKLPSGEMRLVHNQCKATIGTVSNSDRRNTVLGKAGASRWKRRRPKVRGSVMNACDHPHGGGEGRAPIGHAGPRTPWGKPTLGYKTRKDKKYSNNKILTKRK